MLEVWMGEVVEGWLVATSLYMGANATASDLPQPQLNVVRVKKSIKLINIMLKNS